MEGERKPSVFGAMDRKIAARREDWSPTMRAYVEGWRVVAGLPLGDPREGAMLDGIELLAPRLTNEELAELDELLMFDETSAQASLAPCPE